jgi:serralysin
MTGGAGADIFHTFVGAEADVVTDFSIAQGDRVYLLPGTQFTVRQEGADTIVDLGAEGRLTLSGVQMSSLPQGWIFGA